jgi:ribosomal protein S12 methylthiotransferase
MAIQRKISRARNRTLVGREVDVLVEGTTADSELVWQARLSTQAPDIDGVCYISDPGEAPLRAGEFRRMRITKAHDYDLTGELVEGIDVPQTGSARQAAGAELVQIS